MNANIKRVVAAVLLACASTATVSSGKPVSSATYEFNYRRGGEEQILPLQVFDNGRETYFQFSERMPVLPAILIETPTGVVLGKYHRSGPYVVIDGVADRFKLHFGTLVGTVNYGGPAREVQARQSQASEREPSAAAAAVPASVPASSAIPMAPTVAASTSVAAAQRAVQPAAPAQAAVAYPVGPSQHAVLIKPADTPRQVEEKVEARVVFAAGKSTVGGEGVAALMRAIGSVGDVVKIVITGRDDQDFKDGLARARAIQIRAAAINLGVPSQKILMREAFANEGEDATRSTSEVTVVRTVPAAQKAPEAGMPTTVAEAAAMIARGLQALVTLRALDGDRANELLLTVRKVAGLSVASMPPIAPLVRVEAVVPKMPEETWAMLPADGTAQRGMRKWAERAGMTLEWQADVDYPIAAPIVFKGSVRSAFQSVRETLAHAKKPLTIDFDGTRVIVRNVRS